MTTKIVLCLVACGLSLLLEGSSNSLGWIAIYLAMAVMWAVMAWYCNKVSRVAGHNAGSEPRATGWRFSAAALPPAVGSRSLGATTCHVRVLGLLPPSEPCPFDWAEQEGEK